MTVEEISIRISASAEQAIAQLDYVAQQVNALAGGKPLRLLLNTAQAEEKLAVLQSSADQLLTDLSGARTTAAALAGAQTDYGLAIAQLQTLKALSRTTYEQELEYLEALQDGMAAYGLSAKDALDLEKRLLATQAQITARDAQSLDTLFGGITAALSGRYETMRDAELQLLSQSRKAWEAWQESSTSAVQAQIDALDALTLAEDRATQEENYTRRVEKLSQALLYEQDAINKSQLKAQLEAVQAEYEAWREKTTREDEKAALKEQLLAVNERTRAELTALEQQEAAVSSAYTQRLTTAALQAEAEKQLMTASQQELLSLISQFAPQYNAAGQTLGERLLDGFLQKAGSVEGWTDALNGMILTVQQSLNLAMQSAAEAFYAEHGMAAAGVTITQQNTFNTPVESPADTALRIRQANEALAAELLGA